MTAIVISLDFEMRWGMHDILGTNKDAYRENLENVNHVVPALLKMFSDRSIHATWACVGALGCANWEEYFNRAPRPPIYENPTLAVKPEYAEMDRSGSLHFAPDLIKSIQATPGQELGTHTFSHIFMREPGITEQDVFADLAAVSDLWKEKFGGPPVSLVFPRNQYAYLDVVSTMGIRIWRGNQSTWYFNCNEAGNNTLFPRALRLLEDVNPFAKRSYPHQSGLTQASLFVRFNLNDLGWRLHFSRIRNELVSLQPEEVLHLWWHPHNLGSDMKIRLKRAEQVLDLIAEKMAKKDTFSKNMAELF